MNPDVIKTACTRRAYRLEHRELLTPAPAGAALHATTRR
jgi:hypothetical protein